MSRRWAMVVAILFVLGLCIGSAAFAGVSADEAEKLKKELTPFGGVRAGNADGTIPAWEGGIKAAPQGAGYKGPGTMHPDPFAGDKVLFTITAQNMDKYADKLNPGTKAMLKKYASSYKLNVYQTRRTQAAPEWVYENTFKNATRVSMTSDGLGLRGGYGGIPFPIPKRGEEVMFNHLLRYMSGGREGFYTGGLVLPNGTYSPGAGGVGREKFPYNIKGGSPETYNGGLYWALLAYSIPTRRSGEIVLLKDPLNAAEPPPRQAWQYLPGQRRVRMAPTLAYDTPNTTYSGVGIWDDTYLFNGALDRYDWKLVGKKEMYIPYNDYKADLVATKDILTPHHLNPENVRWELHRVWEVEATLKAGKRHEYAKRVFFFDEDSYVAVMADTYDGRGNLWRPRLALSKNCFEIPAIVQGITALYDLQGDTYGVNIVQNDSKGKYFEFEKNLPDSLFSPENLREEGRR